MAPLCSDPTEPPSSNPCRGDPRVLLSARLERALRWAAVCHQGQTRRGSDTPYVQHVMAVAMILDRLGFPEEIVVAGLLHDVVEDTAATLAEVEARFGAEVAAIVGHCTEIKFDSEGRKRPWIDRKRDHLAALDQAPLPSRAVVLADKLHNLLSIQVDLDQGHDVWQTFHAGREDVLWYYRAMIDSLGTATDPRLARLADECRQALQTVADHP